MERNKLLTTETRPVPCELDHNGECLICDCWITDCAYQRLQNEDWKWETKEELEDMFKDWLNTDEECNYL